MNDSSDFVNLIRKVSVQAMENSKPTNVVFGTVVGVSPLIINVEQKLSLSEMQLVLSRNVTDYYTPLSVDNGAIKNYKIHNKLKIDEMVILVRMQGGQKYVVLDRVVKL